MRRPKEVTGRTCLNDVAGRWNDSICPLHDGRELCSTENPRGRAVCVEGRTIKREENDREWVIEVSERATAMDWATATVECSARGKLCLHPPVRKTRAEREQRVFRKGEVFAKDSSTGAGHDELPSIEQRISGFREHVP